MASQTYANSFSDLRHMIMQKSSSGPLNECIICMGNPGCGKSTILNAMMEEDVFQNGFSAGTGLTQQAQLHKHKGVWYMDTPGLADVARREQAAQELNLALSFEANFKIFFVVTLESGLLRAQDRATLDLITEALPDHARKHIGVIVNKASCHDESEIASGRVKFGPFAGNTFFERVTCVKVDLAVEDADLLRLHVSSSFKDFVMNTTSVYIKAGDVQRIEHDKFEQFKAKFEQEIVELREHHKELLTKINELTDFQNKVIPEIEQTTVGQDSDLDILNTLRVRFRNSLNELTSCRKLLADHGIPYDKSFSSSQRDHKDVLVDVAFQKGDSVITVDNLRVASTVIPPGQQGQIADCGVHDDTAFLKAQFLGRPEQVQILEPSFTSICHMREVDTIRRSKVRELAHRGIELHKILDFYGSLEKTSFQPDSWTTADVVREAIIPATQHKGVSYARFVHPEREQRLAERMVSHNWGNLFSHLIAAVVADALDNPIYETYLTQLEPKRLPYLKDKLREEGKLDLAYWICPFSVNQHRSICKKLASCPCETTVHPTGSPECEIDQFDSMMLFMFDHPSRDRQRHVIAIDQEGAILNRIWVAAELVAVLTSAPLASLRQNFVTHSSESLKRIMSSTRGRGVSIWDCIATSVDDENMIKEKSKFLIQSMNMSMDQFHEKLNSRIFRSLLETERKIEDASKERILCIGNSGVGTTTIINAMIGKQVFGKEGPPGELREYFDGDRAFLEAPGLANSKTRCSAARAITGALRKDGKYKLFFIITLESGRVRPEDKETIRLVLEAASIGDAYSILINKVSTAAAHKLSDASVLQKIRDELRFGHSRDLVAPSSIQWIFRAEGSGIPQLPQDLLSNAPSIIVKGSFINNISEESEEKIQERLIRERDQLQRDNVFHSKQLEKLVAEKQAHFFTEAAQGAEDKYQSKFSNPKNSMQSMVKSEGSMRMASTRRDLRRAAAREKYPDEEAFVALLREADSGGSQEMMDFVNEVATMSEEDGIPANEIMRTTLRVWEDLDRVQQTLKTLEIDREYLWKEWEARKAMVATIKEHKMKLETEASTFSKSCPASLKTDDQLQHYDERMGDLDFPDLDSRLAQDIGNISGKGFRSASKGRESRSGRLPSVRTSGGSRARGGSRERSGRVSPATRATSRSSSDMKSFRS